MQRRAMSLTGPTLLPELRNKARVPTVAVLLTPKMRPVKNSSVNAEHSDLNGIRSVVKLSNVTTLGASSSSASSCFWHSSSVVGNATADGVPGPANAEMIPDK